MIAGMSALKNLAPRPLRYVKSLVFVAALLPLAQLIWLGFNDGLGANPIEWITHSTGTWTLVGLMVTLSITPLRKVSGWNWLIRLRRMLGLFAFFLCLSALHYIHLAGSVL